MTKPAAYITIKAPVEHTQHYETAAWHRTSRSEVGTFACTLSRTGYNQDGEFIFAVELPAKITSACLVSLFGGVAYGNDPGKQEVGKASSFTHSVNAYDVFSGSSASLNCGIKGVSSAALKQIEAYFRSVIVKHTELMQEYQSQADWGMVSHCAEIIAKAARGLECLLAYRAKRVAHNQGRLAHKHGQDRNDNPYERIQSYCAFIAWHDGFNHASKQLATA